VIKNRGVARLHLLVAALSFSGVVEASVSSPAVEVSVGLASNRVGKEEDVRRTLGRPDSALRSAPVALLQFLALNFVTGFQSPNGRIVRRVHLTCRRVGYWHWLSESDIKITYPIHHSTDQPAILDGETSNWVAWISLALATGAILTAALRTVPSAVRLGTKRDSIHRQSALARSILHKHLACIAAILTVLILQLAST
jgi:hypothetical protein